MAPRWRVRYPGGVTLLHILALLCSGCAAEVVDGTWRHPGNHATGSEHSYELSLEQYGTDVVGLLRTYEKGGSGATADPYLRSVHCRPLLPGAELRDNQLRFDFFHLDNEEHTASFKLSDDEQLLGSLDPRVPSLSEPVWLERVSDDVDRRHCGTLTEPFEIEPELGGDADEWPGDTRVALVYRVSTDSGSYWIPEQVGERIPGTRRFEIQLTTVPMARAYQKDTGRGGVRFAYAVFIAFEDHDRDGRWRVDGSPPEPVVGVDPDRALIYLEGRGEEVFPSQPDLLDSISPQYTLVEVQSDAGSGALISVQPTDRDPVLVLADDDTSAPRLEPQ